MIFFKERQLPLLVIVIIIIIIIVIITVMVMIHDSSCMSQTFCFRGKVVIAELEKIPAEFLKQIIIQGMNEPAKIGGGY